MEQVYEIIAKRTNKKAQNVILLLFIGAAALLGLTIPLRGISFLWVIQLTAIVMLVIAVMLVSRYIAKAYIYRVEPVDGRVDLTVTEASTNGKRRVTVCRISLGSVRKRVLLEGKEGADALKKHRSEKKRFYDYRPDLLPEKSVLILSDEGGEEVYICLAYDETIYSCLSPATPDAGEEE